MHLTTYVIHNILYAQTKFSREGLLPVNIDEKIKKLSPAKRKKVEARAAELIAEEMTLRDLRKARELTQARMGGTARHHAGRRLQAREAE